MKIESISVSGTFTTGHAAMIRVLHQTERQSIGEATLEPDQATRRHFHRVTEEIYFIVKGAGEMEVDGEKARVKPGDAILIPVESWHQLYNDGTSELRFLCSCVPPYDPADAHFE